MVYRLTTRSLLLLLLLAFSTMLKRGVRPFLSWRFTLARALTSVLMAAKSGGMVEVGWWSRNGSGERFRHRFQGHTQITWVTKDGGMIRDSFPGINSPG